MSYDKVIRNMGLDPLVAKIKYRRYLMQLPIDKNTKILEIGCGRGLLAHYLQWRFGCTVHALDSYAGQGNKSDAKYINFRIKKELGTSVSIYKSRLIDFKPSIRYNIVIADMMLHHIAPTKDRFIDGLDRFETIVANLKVIKNLVLDTFVIAEVVPITKEYYNYDKIVATGVEPESKHYPWEWIHALMRAGFSSFETRYIIPKFGTDCSKYRYVYVLEAI